PTAPGMGGRVPQSRQLRPLQGRSLDDRLWPEPWALVLMSPLMLHEQMADELPNEPLERAGMKPRVYSPPPAPAAQRRVVRRHLPASFVPKRLNDLHS